MNFIIDSNFGLIIFDEINLLFSISEDLGTATNKAYHIIGTDERYAKWLAELDKTILVRFFPLELRPNYQPETPKEVVTPPSNAINQRSLSFDSSNEMRGLNESFESIQTRTQPMSERNYSPPLFESTLNVTNQSQNVTETQTGPSRPLKKTRLFH